MRHPRQLDGGYSVQSLRMKIQERGSLTELLAPFSGNTNHLNIVLLCSYYYNGFPAAFPFRATTRQYCSLRRGWPWLNVSDVSQGAHAVALLETSDLPSGR